MTRHCVQEEMTQQHRQFKKQQVDKKVTHNKLKYADTPAANIFERRRGQTLKPLVDGSVQIHKNEKG